MAQIKSKVYYEIATGNVLTITSESEGGVIEKNKNDDMTECEQLKSYNENEVDYIELEYGTSLITCNNAKSFNVDLATKKLQVEYLTQSEIDEIMGNI